MSRQDTDNLVVDPPSRVDAGAILNKEFVFVIGSDRSGTTWLQSLIGAHPSVATSVQMTVFHSYVPQLLQAWKSEVEFVNDPEQWDMGLPIVWGEKEFYGFLQGFVVDVYRRVLEKNLNATHVLDKHPAYRERVNEINELMPNARFIHVIRDGRDVALSMMAAKQSLGWGFDEVAESAAAWSRFVTQGRKAAKFTDRYLEVRYEDMHSDCASQLRTVYEFCGLDLGAVDVEKVAADHSFSKMKKGNVSPDSERAAPLGHYRRGVAGSWRDELSSHDKYRVDRAAGRMLVELGYAELDWWYTSRTNRMSILMIDKMRKLRKRISGSLRHLLTGSSKPKR